MATAVKITQYDPQTRRYVAELTVTEGEKSASYRAEGTWHDEDAPMVAGALYDQHKARQAKDATIEAEKQAIGDKIAAEVAKVAVTAEVK